MFGFVGSDEVVGQRRADGPEFRVHFQRSVPPVEPPLYLAGDQAVGRKVQDLQIECEPALQTDSCTEPRIERAAGKLMQRP